MDTHAQIHPYSHASVMPVYGYIHTHMRRQAWTDWMAHVQLHQMFLSWCVRALALNSAVQI